VQIRARTVCNGSALAYTGTRVHVLVTANIYSNRIAKTALVLSSTCVHNGAYSTVHRIVKSLKR
jgi:hypothetical protein